MPDSRPLLNPPLLLFNSTTRVATAIVAPLTSLCKAVRKERIQWSTNRMLRSGSAKFEEYLKHLGIFAAQELYDKEFQPNEFLRKSSLRGSKFNSSHNIRTARQFQDAGNFLYIELYHLKGSPEFMEPPAIQGVSTGTTEVPNDSESKHLQCVKRWLQKLDTEIEDFELSRFLYCKYVAEIREARAKKNIQIKDEAKSREFNKASNNDQQPISLTALDVDIPSF